MVSGSALCLFFDSVWKVCPDFFFSTGDSSYSAGNSVEESHFFKRYALEHFFAGSICRKNEVILQRFDGQAVYVVE